MTARDDLAALLDRKCWRCGSRPDTDDLDAIASLATNPETAPAVFAWLVEVGVLELPESIVQAMAEAESLGGCQECGLPADARIRLGQPTAHPPADYGFS